MAKISKSEFTTLGLKAANLQVSIKKKTRPDRTVDGIINRRVIHLSPAEIDAMQLELDRINKIMDAN